MPIINNWIYRFKLQIEIYCLCCKTCVSLIFFNHQNPILKNRSPNMINYEDQWEMWFELNELELKFTIYKLLRTKTLIWIKDFKWIHLVCWECKRINLTTDLKFISVLEIQIIDSVSTVHLCVFTIISHLCILCVFKSKF